MSDLPWIFRSTSVKPVADDTDRSINESTITTFQTCPKGPICVQVSEHAAKRVWKAAAKRKHVRGRYTDATQNCNKTVMRNKRAAVMK